MLIPREIVYCDKTSLELFNIKAEGSLNHLIYKNWMLRRTDLMPGVPNVKKRQIKAFNDAYYICTLALLHNVNVDFVAYCLQRIELPSVVLPLAYFYLSKVKTPPTDVSTLLILLETEIERQGWQKNLEAIKTVGGKKIDASFFAPREITPKLLSSIHWCKATSRFKPKAIKRLISYIAKNSDEMKMMAEAIINGIKEFEWENENDGYFDDEIGEWVKYKYDFTDAYQLCHDVINTNGECILHEKHKDETSNRLQINEKKFAPKRLLTDFLKENWFDDHSTNREKYTEEWRAKLVEDLIESEYGPEIVVLWHAKIRKGASKCNMIKLGLAGCLIKVGVLKCSNYTALAKKIGFPKLKQDTIADYMGSKAYLPYYTWLKEYVETNHEEAFSD